MCRLIEANGWSLKRINGSHHIYGKPGERKVISVPVHGSKYLKAGLALRIARGCRRRHLDRLRASPINRAEYKQSAPKTESHYHQNPVNTPWFGPTPTRRLEGNEWNI